MENQTKAKEPALTLVYEISIITANDYIDLERLNKYKAAATKRTFTNRIKFWTLSQVKPNLMMQGTYDLVVDWYRKDRRHDADNVYFGIKFLLDGIVAAGVVADDSRKHIRNISHRIHDGKKMQVVMQFLKI